MWILVIIAIIVAFLLWSVFSKPIVSPGHTKIDVNAPHPEKCQDKSMFDFIAATANYKLEPIFKEYVKQGLLVKPLYMDAYHEKIKNDYISLTYYYEKACIDEIPPRTTADILHEIKEKTAAERLIYTTTVTFEVTGVHVPARKSVIRSRCSEDDQVDLVPEPSNKFDKNAIKVRCNDRLIGYIASVDTREVKDIIRQSHYSYISSISDYEDYLAVEISIEY